MTSSLIAPYDGLVCDLDGVVYAGPAAVPYAVESLNRARDLGRRVIYATNNASRPPVSVVKHLTQLGLKCTDQDVVNSSIAGAHVLQQYLHGGQVLAVGGDGVALALTDAGFDSIRASLVGTCRSDSNICAVLQGYGPSVTAQDLAEAAYAIQGGALWVATNTDRTLPTDRGQAPGNGSLVAAVGVAVDSSPIVAGKPEPVMYELACERMGLPREKVLAIGDRLETDIEGAVSGGFDSILVLTGVHGWADAAAASPSRRPSYVLEDLRGLFVPYDVASESVGAPTSSSSAPQLRAALMHAWQQVDCGVWEPEQAAGYFQQVTS